MNDKNQLDDSTIEIENIFLLQSFTTHLEFLINWKLKIVFSKERWKPNEKPIWNEHTTSLLKQNAFPQSLKGIRDKIEKLEVVGSIIAEMNGWIFVREITAKNKNAEQLRTIFRSRNNGKALYLSIDFKNPGGRFELCDYKGKHIGEIKFLDGEFTEGSGNSEVP